MAFQVLEKLNILTPTTMTRQLFAQLVFTHSRCTGSFRIFCKETLPGLQCPDRSFAGICMGFFYRAGFHFLYLYPFPPPSSGVISNPGLLARCCVLLYHQRSLSLLFFIRCGTHRQQQLSNQQLLNARLTPNLNRRKDQINSHFLFNTLNNLYGLTLKNPEKGRRCRGKVSLTTSYALRR